MSVHGKRSHRQRAIEFLAREWRVPIHQVTQLYESEWAELAVDARIAGFLPIFAFRNARRTLRQRARAIGIPTQPPLMAVAGDVPIDVDRG
jgi:Protein of unknown function (DUF3562)